MDKATEERKPHLRFYDLRTIYRTRHTRSNQTSRVHWLEGEKQILSKAVAIIAKYELVVCIM